MNKERDARSEKLRLAYCAIPFWIIGAMSFFPVVIIGGNFLDAIRVNWIAYSFNFAGVGIALFAFVGWLRLGLQQRKNARSKSGATKLPDNSP